MSSLTSSQTPQQLAAEWECEVAVIFGGERQAGPGARGQLRLDVAGNQLVIEAKDTKHESFSVTTDMLEKALDRALGPASASPGVTPIVAIRLGAARRRLAVVDLDVLAGWLVQPPGLVPASSQDQLRATARTSSLLR